MKAPLIHAAERVSPENAWVLPARRLTAFLHEHWIGLVGLLAVCILAGAPLFYLGLFDFIEADHDGHVQFVQRGIEQGVWPVHFLYPTMLYGLSGFSHDFVPLAWTALVLLTLCVVAKAWLSYGLLAGAGPGAWSGVDPGAHRWSHAALLLLVSTALILSAPIVRPWWTNRVYMGQISPNLWHNPTSILCWPIVIALFFAAERFLCSGGWKPAAVVGLLSAVSVMAKPNYFLAFAPVYGVLALWIFGFSRRWMFSQLAMLPTVLLLCWQLMASFNGHNAMRPGLHIAWAPLATWQLYSDSILISLLFSVAFPLSYLVVFRHWLQNRQRLVFAWGVFLSALAWAAFPAEVYNIDGTVNGDFNFSWGAHQSLFIVFLVTALDMFANPAAMKAFGSRAMGVRFAILPWCLLGAHAVSGVYWIIRQAIGRGFF